MSDSKNAFALINVGRTKTGKTTQTKKFIEEAPAFLERIVYDVNNEYGEFYGKPFVSFDLFMESIKDKTNSLIVIEEASIFFDVRSTDKILREMLVKKRHTNNFFVLNFHYFSTIPKYVFNLVDFVKVFKTNDSLKTVKEKYDNMKLLNAFTIVNSSEDNFAFKTVSLY